MEVLAREFATESNVNVPTICTVKQYGIGLGENCIQKMGIREVFERSDVTLIPSIYANVGAASVVEESAFTYVEHMFIDTLKENLHEIDGIFLILHGASEVEELGSRDHHVLKELRELVSPHSPIMIVCNPHGNLYKECAESAIIPRSYRESPHTDADETVEGVTEMLCELLKKRRNIHVAYYKLPLILGGEQGVSAGESVLSINRYMDELEKDNRILSCSQRVGCIHHDCDVAGCGIVVAPYSGQDSPYAQEAADRLATYVWEKRHEFRYVGLTASPFKTLQMALDLRDKPAFITDSGDNITSGATGWNTGILRQALQTRTTKELLFATICDPTIYQTLSIYRAGEELFFTLGVDFDELSNAVELDTIVKNSGNLTGFMTHDHTSVLRHYVNVRIEGTSIDIIIADTGWAACKLHQFVGTDINVDTCDVIAVKQGYIFPDFRAKGKLYVISLTKGATLQDTARLPFERIMHLMFPTDDI